MDLLFLPPPPPAVLLVLGKESINICVSLYSCGNDVLRHATEGEEYTVYRTVLYQRGSYRMTTHRDCDLLITCLLTKFLLCLHYTKIFSKNAFPPKEMFLLI